MKYVGNVILTLVTLFQTFQSVTGQGRPPDIYLNHLFIVLDSTTYRKLFDVDFISQKLGNVNSSTVSTTEDSWSGKYLYGKNGYFEFFSPSSFAGAMLGDCGLGFMTFKSKDILKVEKHWKKISGDSLKMDTTTYLSGDKRVPWFYSLFISRKDSIQSLSTWLMENTPEELEIAGFSKEEIEAEILWQDYMAKRTKKEFTKSFNTIKSVELSVNKKEYKVLEKTMLGFGLQKKRTTFFNDQIKIVYKIDETHPVRLESVETELEDVFPDSIITISNSLSIHINGKRAIWEFNY